MARTNDLSISFISTSKKTSGKPAEIAFLDIIVDTQVPSNINFFGASVVKSPDAVIMYNIM